MAILALFPAFFVYHSLAAHEVLAVPLVFGGWWSYANAAVALALGGIFLLSREFAQPAHWHFILLCAWVAANTVWHHVEGSELQRLDLVFAENAKLTIGWTALYLVGFYLRLSNNFASLMAALVAACAASVPFLIQTDPFSPFDDDRRRFQGEVASYQFFGNALAFAALVAIAASRSVTIQAILLLVANSAIFLLGSRSETIGMGMITILWFSALWFRTRAFPWKAAILVSACALLAIGMGLAANAEAVNRYLDAFDLSKSQSWQLRGKFLFEGFSDIRASWLWGEYAGQMKGKDVGTQSEQTLAFGQYIHNALSLWRQHGLVPFGLFAALSVFALHKGWRLVFREKSEHPEARLLLYVAAYTILLAALTKSVYWPMSAFAWGLAVAAHGRQGGRDQSAQS